MTITKARKKFEELKTQILADGKVDITEAYVLIEFIEEYAKTGKKTFVDFKELLTKCAADHVITDEESKELINAIDGISAFLKVEQVVEYVFFSLVGILVVAGIIYAAL